MGARAWRRGGMGLVGALMVASSWTGVARAEATCAPGADGREACTAGIRSDTIEATVAAEGGQRMSQWCWAASIAMVFRYYGYEVSQERIVAETFGQVVNMPGTTQQIVTTLSREWRDDRGRRFQVTAGLVSRVDAAAELAADRPLMVGTLGHAMVLTALEYVKDPWYGDSVTRAIVRDPWPGRGRRELMPEEWNGADMLLGIRVVGSRTAPVARSEKSVAMPAVVAVPEHAEPPGEDFDVDEAAMELEAMEREWNELLLFLSRL